MFIPHLKLVDPPKIVSSLERNISLRAGNELVLNCRATGLPRPQISWSRSGRVFRNHTLVVSRANKKDSGLYLCKAYSPAGNDSMKIFVRVDDGNKPTQATGGEITWPGLYTVVTYTDHNTDIIGFFFFFFLFCLLLLAVRSRSSYEVNMTNWIVSVFVSLSKTCFCFLIFFYYYFYFFESDNNNNNNNNNSLMISLSQPKGWITRKVSDTNRRQYNTKTIK